MSSPAQVWLSLALLLSLATLGRAEPAVEVRLLAGPGAAGALTTLNDRQLTLTTDDGPRTFDAAQLLQVKFATPAAPAATPPAAAAAAMWVELVDGSQAPLASYVAAKGKATIGLAAGDAVEAASRSIAAVRFRVQEGDLAAQWRKLVASPRTADLLVVRKTAGPAPTLDYLEGVIHAVTDEKVHFEFDGDPLEVARAKVEGLVFYHPVGRQLPEPLCSVETVDGARWLARDTSLADGHLEVTTTSGFKLRTPAARLSRLDYSLGKIAFLSDLEPDSVEWVSYFDARRAAPGLARLFAPRRDRGFDGGPILLGGVAYEKGLVVHSRTEMVYRLPGQFRRFLATAGLEDAVGDAGHVILTIYGDGRKLAEHALAGSDPEPTPLQLDVEGVRLLKIVVDFGEDLDIADHLVLADAKVTK